MKKVITALTATAAISTYAFAQDAEASSHTVKGGDTLWSIAQKNNVSVAQIKSWNNLSSDLILVNQNLKVSGSSSSDSSSSSNTSSSSSSSSTSSSTSASSSSSNTSTGGSYTVKAGDTLSSIARANGMNYRTLMSINNISGHIIHPGQTLKLSSSASSGNTSSSSTSSNTSSASDNSSSASSSSNSGSSYNAPAPSSASSWGTNWYSWGDCTWYAFERRKQLGKPVGNGWGNASNWAGQARSAGYSVNNSPSVGAIIQAHAWTNNAWGMGHVGVVERINPDGSILISEMNFGTGVGVKGHRTLSASQAANHNFIH